MTSPALTAFRASNAVLGRIAPKATGRRVGRTFTTPRPRPLRPWEREVEAGAERITLTTGLSALHWAGTGPRVLALHGWEGRATQFGALAGRLAPTGADITALDGPAHGSSIGTRANPVAFARALIDAERELGHFDVVVGHSMGAAAAGLAVSWGLAADKAVLIAGPSSLPGVVHRFARFVRLPSRAAENFIREIEAVAGMPASHIDIDTIADRLTMPVLALHDVEDVDVPVDESRRLAATLPNVTLVETRGLGHNRILRDPAVIDRIAEFIAA